MTAAVTRSEEVSDAPQRHRVLVVDDRAQSRAQIRARLEERGFEVLEAVDGEDGYSLYQEQNPDAVITDMKMPKADGMSLLQKIPSEKTPVFCITAYPNWKASAHAVKRGAWNYYKWPQDLNALLDDLGNALDPNYQESSEPAADECAELLSSARHHGRLQKDEERRAELMQLIQTESGNISRIAEKLEVDRKTVYSRLKRYGFRT